MQRVIDSQLLATGVKLSVLTIKRTDPIYEARIEQIRDGNLLITMPSLSGSLMQLIVGSQIRCMFVDSDKHYVFESTVNNFIKEQIKMVAISLPNELKTIELRAYFRVPVEHFVKMYPVFEDNSFSFKMVGGGNNNRPSYYGSCVDLSGGGAKLICKNGLADIEFIDIDFSSILQGITLLRCKVTRSIEISNNNFNIGVKFHNLKDYERDLIIKYIFKRQIEIRNSINGG